MKQVDYPADSITASAEETLALGEQFGKQLTPGSVIALSGALGAGKTVFARGIAAALGIADTITSPTYTIINEYDGTIPLYHMDAYRLMGDDDFRLAGAEDYLYRGGICVIEWPERLTLLPGHALWITITIEADGKRRFHCERSNSPW
jgi:tRNA threonylcarbamoyladenosine biosynthesis protein TsaE